MGDCLGNTGPVIDDNPNWENSIFHKGNLPANTVVIDDMDLGCDPQQATDDPLPSLEGYWDRNDLTGDLYPKVLADRVHVGKNAQSYDENFGVLGKIYTSAGYMFGPGNLLMFANDSTTIAFNVVSRNSVYIKENHIRGSQANAWMLNTLSPTTGPGTPPYTFYTDTDTGMYRPEANALAFAGGGANLFVLNADGTIQLPNVPATAADEAVPVLARNASTGLIEQRVLAELHTHSNKAVLDLLTAPAGSLWYNGSLVFDPSPYYTSTEVDALDAALLVNINTRSLNTHNHNLADLTEHSYNSLVDLPDLSELHSHTNKPTLDRMPDYTTANDDDVMVRSGAGIVWLPLSGIGSGLWLRDVVGTPFLYPAVTTDEIHIDVINEYTTAGNITLGGVLTVDQANARVGVGVPVPAHDLDVAGSGRFGDTTPGQSVIGYGLIINNNSSALAIGDFQVNTVTYSALFADTSADSILIMSNALGGVGFFGETPTAQSTGWTVTNHVLDKILDANATSINEVCDVLGELITELKLKGILGG